MRIHILLFVVLCILSCAGGKKKSVIPKPCGNGQADPGEECDDGNRLGGDGCSEDCTVEPGWSCDTGFPTLCIPVCGDGRVVGTEGCDDGNRLGGDGCSEDCTVEPGWSCESMPSVCTLLCGNGILDPGEECDDGNAIPGDGCENDCTLSCTVGEQRPCGSCGSQTCLEDRSWSLCAEFCDDRECGPDPCGTNCGSCGEHYECMPRGNCRLNSTCPGASLPGAPAFGFNYAPQGHLCKWAGTGFWLVQDAFERDLDIMASLGTRVVRLMLLPYCLGIRIRENMSAGDWDPDEMMALAEALPIIIERFAAHGMAVIIGFGPNALYWNGPDHRKWWQYMYGDDGWEDFIKDTVDWSRAVVEIVETSNVCQHVLYYDLHNEVDYRVPRMQELVAAQLEEIPVPDAKRGLSLLYVHDAWVLEGDVNAAGKPLRFVEFHSYPDRNHNVDLQAANNTLSTHFPDATVILGEYGSIFCENGQDETAGMNTVMGIMDATLAAGLPMALHWMLWDRTEGTGCEGNERVGLGFGQDHPRNAFGAMAQRLSRGPNPDFETDMANWFSGGTTPSHVLFRMGPNRSDSATNQYYGRLVITEAGTYWFCNTWFDISGSRLALSGYVRHANLTGSGIDIHFGDASGEISIASHPLVLPPVGWHFQNLQNGLSGYAFDVPPGATRAFVCFLAQTGPSVNESAPAYLDLDALSFHEYTPLP